MTFALFLSLIFVNASERKIFLKNFSLLYLVLDLILFAVRLKRFFSRTLTLNTLAILEFLYRRKEMRMLY